MTSLQQPQDDALKRAAEMARLGAAKTPKKAAAARKNGKLGGWTKGRPLSEETRRKISATKTLKMLERLFPREKDSG